MGRRAHAQVSGRLRERSSRRAVGGLFHRLQFALGRGRRGTPLHARMHACDRAHLRAPAGLKTRRAEGHILVLGVSFGQLVADLEPDDVEVLFWVCTRRAGRIVAGKGTHGHAWRLRQGHASLPSVRPARACPSPSCTRPPSVSPPAPVPLPSSRARPPCGQHQAGGSTLAARSIPAKGVDNRVVQKVEARLRHLPFGHRRGHPAVRAFFVFLPQHGVRGCCGTFERHTQVRRAGAGADG